MFNGGPLTPPLAGAVERPRKAEIDMAIIAESARWGDSKHEPPYTKNNLANGNERFDYMDPARTAIVLNQFRNTTLYNNGSLRSGAAVSEFQRSNANRSRWR